MPYTLKEFDKGEQEMTKVEVENLKPLLLSTGKFVEINGDIINISSIKSIRKPKLPCQTPKTTELELEPRTE